MQIFIIGNPYETALTLDKRRLNKQVIETGQIIDAICYRIHGRKGGAWRNHPVVIMYQDHLEWLTRYGEILDLVRLGHKIEDGDGVSNLLRSTIEEAEKLKPHFHTQEFFHQMKRRLYTKDNQHYSQWASLGESEENWYFVDGGWIKYKNGKREE